MSRTTTTRDALPTLPCLCATLRRASRAVTQQYDDALRPHGLRATQFNILQALALAGAVSQGELARILAMDSTTLTRTLRILSRHAWVAKRPGRDQRERLLSLTPAGGRKLRHALPAWRKVQAGLRAKLGPTAWARLAKWSDQLTRAVTKGGGSP